MFLDLFVCFLFFICLVGLLVLFSGFWDTVSLGGSSPGKQTVHQASLEFKEICLPMTWVLRLNACTTAAQLKLFFFMTWVSISFAEVVYGLKEASVFSMLLSQLASFLGFHTYEWFLEVLSTCLLLVWLARNWFYLCFKKNNFGIVSFYPLIPCFEF